MIRSRIPRAGTIPVRALLPTGIATLAMAGLTAASALARGGGGSHSFGGGSSSHSSGGSSGGHLIYHNGSYYYYSSGNSGNGVDGGVVAAIIGGVVLLIVLIIVGLWLWRRAKRAEQHHKLAQREHRVQAAAAEAAEEDAAFDSETVRNEGTKLFGEIQKAWSSNDRNRLQKLVGPELWVEWKRRLEDFERKGWHNQVTPQGEPKVEYVGLRNAADAQDDRVCVRIEAQLRDYVVDAQGQHITRTDSHSELSKMAEYWTLGKSRHKQAETDLDWILISIEQDREGAHELKEKLVATPWSDDAAARDEALVEQAASEAAPEGTNIAELADLNFTGDAHAAANDLSVADGRFAPDVLEIAARRAVAAWAQGIDGDRKPLEAIADGPVVEELLHPGDASGKTRLVVRGPQVKEIRITALDAKAEPPSMSLEVDLSGKRYIEDRDTTEVVSGSQSHNASFTEHWTLAVTGDGEQPWRLVAVGTPAPA